MPETVLLVCTSNPPHVTTAIKILRETLFRSPEIHLLCIPSEVSHYEKAFALERITIFPHRRDYAAAVRLCRKVRKTNYDVVAVLWCRDEGRSRAKWFALFCGGKRFLVFNENLDCDYLKLSYLLAILSSRARGGTLFSHSWIPWIRTTLRPGFWGLMRLMLAPLRFTILLFSAGFLRLSKSKRVE